jgi:predicted GTPase
LISKLPQAKQWKVQYKTNEDFGTMVADNPRLMTVGCTGAGKSTLINRLGGCHYVCKESSDGKISFEWDAEPVFEVDCATQGVTTCTSFANLNYLGKEDRPFICVDTPGHDDPGGINMTDDNSEGHKARDTILTQAGDLYEKLKQMKHVNCILVLHNDVNSNRLNPATYEVLEKIDQMFAESDGNVWNHVIVAYSKCDAESRGWKANLDKKVKDFQSELKKKFTRCKDIDVPVITVSGVEYPDKESDMSGFEKLWELLKTKPKLSTSNLQKFNGLSAKIEDIIRQREFFQRQAEARKNFTSTAMLTMAFVMGFLGVVRPWINIDSYLDEFVYIGGFIYCMGMYKMTDFGKIVWDDYALDMLVKKNVITSGKADNLRLVGGPTSNKKED